MADNYTPTTEEVRGDYANFQLPAEGGDFRDEYADGLAGFDRWLAAHDADKRAEWEAEQGEVEWEYSIAYPRCGEWYTDGVEPFESERDALDDLEKGDYLSSDRVVRRRKAGEWVPVNENGSAERRAGQQGASAAASDRMPPIT